MRRPSARTPSALGQGNYDKKAVEAMEILWAKGVQAERAGGRIAGACQVVRFVSEAVPATKASRAIWHDGSSFSIALAFAMSL